MLSHYAQLSSSIHTCLFCSMHAYLVGLEALDLFCLSLPVSMHPLSSLCAHGHNNGSEVCASSQRPSETAQACPSRRCSHNRLICFISLHVFQIVSTISCLK